MSGLPAGAIAYFLSFNHDTGGFEIVASGSVSADAMVITSDQGAGLSVAGWGCNCPPYAVAGDCESGTGGGEGEGEGEGKPGCSTECVSSGEITGGEIRTFGSEEVVCIGEALTWYVDPPLFDSGGMQLETCRDEDGEVISETSQFVDPVAPTATWEVRFNDTTVVASGEGTIASHFPAEAGKYTCSYNANVDRDCPPAELALTPKDIWVTDV
jgi:hypothetical protein